MIDALTTLYAMYPAAACGLALLIGLPVVVGLFALVTMQEQGE